MSPAEGTATRALGDGLTATADHALVTDSGLLAIADLHIGFEGALQSEGVAFPHYQRKPILARLERLLDAHDPDAVVVCGDFKHTFARNLRQEWREVEEVLAFLAARARVVLVRGNHDNYLAAIASRRGLRLHRAWRRENLTFAHGHEVHEARKGTREPVTVIGHEHPGAALLDAVGASVKMPCFLHGPRGQGRLVVLPAFSPLSLHTEVSRASREGFLSPYLQGAPVSRFAVTAVSELGLLEFGTVAGLRSAAGRL